MISSTILSSIKYNKNIFVKYSFYSTVASTTTIPSNLLINPVAESGTLSTWIIGGSGVSTIDDGSTNSGLNPHSGTKQFYSGSISTSSTSTLTQSVLLLNGTQG
jgi:hypothetical protein